MNKFLPVVFLGILSAPVLSQDNSSFLESADTDAASSSKTTSSSSSSEVKIESLWNLEACKQYADYYFYDFTALRSDKDYSINTSSHFYQFNFCQYISSPCGISESNDTVSVDVYSTVSKSNQYCYLLGGDDTSIQTVIDDNTTHLLLTHSGGSNCYKTNLSNASSSSVTFDIKCDANINHLDTSTVTVNEADICNPIISFSHAQGCPDDSLDTISIFLQNYPWVVAIPLIVFGAFICFFGRRFIPWAIAIAGGFIAFLIIFALCAAMGMLDYIDPTSDGGSVTWVIVAFFLSLGVAAGVGLALKELLIFGLLILTFIAGFLLGGLVYNLVFAGWASSTVLLAILTFGSAIALTIFAYFNKIKVIIFSTAFVGSYFFMRGWSVFFGGYPNEITLYQEISNGTDEYNTTFLIYLAFIIIFFLAGGFVQFKNIAKGVQYNHLFVRL